MDASPRDFLPEGSEGGRPNGVSLEFRIRPAANQIVKTKAHEYQQEFSTRISELGDELCQYPEWKEVSTKIKRTAAAVKFLMEKANGYRLSNALAQDVRHFLIAFQYGTQSSYDIGR